MPWSFSIPPENIRKSDLFWCIQEVQKEFSDMKWVNLTLNSKLRKYICKHNNISDSNMCIVYGGYFFQLSTTTITGCKINNTLLM